MNRLGPIAVLAVVLALTGFIMRGAFSVSREIEDHFNSIPTIERIDPKVYEIGDKMGGFTVFRFEKDGHTYIAVQRPKNFGFTHDPDCDCGR
jgi:uncharacterized protein YneF (UPF0154 family)